MTQNLQTISERHTRYLQAKKRYEDACETGVVYTERLEALKEDMDTALTSLNPLDALGYLLEGPLNMALNVENLLIQKRASEAGIHPIQRENWRLKKEMEELRFKPDADLIARSVEVKAVVAEDGNAVYGIWGDTREEVLLEYIASHDINVENLPDDFTVTTELCWNGDGVYMTHWAELKRDLAYSIYSVFEGNTDINVEYAERFLENLEALTQDDKACEDIAELALGWIGRHYSNPQHFVYRPGTQQKHSKSDLKRILEKKKEQDEVERDSGGEQDE